MKTSNDSLIVCCLTTNELYASYSNDEIK